MHVQLERIAKLAKKLGMYVSSIVGIRFYGSSVCSFFSFLFTDPISPFLFVLANPSPYAPCLLGFEGHGGNRTPTIRGIVVHVHNEQLLREAHAEMANHQLEEDRNSYEKSMWKKWKRLLEGVLIRDRLEREYGDE